MKNCPNHVHMAPFGLMLIRFGSHRVWDAYYANYSIKHEMFAILEEPDLEDGDYENLADAADKA